MATQTKHFLHDPDALVLSALHSLTLTNPSLALDAANKIVYRRPAPAAKSNSPSHSSQKEQPVSLVCGGGSGHEPSFAGLVGHGLLTAAVAGTIFASPSAEQVRRCLLSRLPAPANAEEEGEAEGGILVIVMNYTGDILNFGMGVEKAKAAGRRAEMLVVADDVGVGRAQGGKVGRRGIAGTVLVVKIAGALASMGESFEKVRSVAGLVAENVVSVGVSLAHVHVPGRNVDNDEKDLKEGEVEIGMGIHNEAGSARVKENLSGLVKSMLGQLLDQGDGDRAFIKIDPHDKTVLLVNNMGGVSVLEMGGITHEVVGQLEKDWNIRPARVLSGTYMTSLNGLGFSISLLKVLDTGLGKDKGMMELLDAPAEAVGWPVSVRPETWDNRSDAERDAKGEGEEARKSGLSLDPTLAKEALQKALSRLIAAEPDVTRYDTVVGDGDCGIGLKRGAEAILALLESAAPSDDVAIFLHSITQVVETAMDGTSGALYAIFLNALTRSMLDQSPPSTSSSSIPTTAQMWAKALQSSLESLGNYTPAQPGDRTLIDALHPFVTTLARTGEVKMAADKAAEGARSTKGMKASLGRTVYIGGEGWQEVPDPGAYGLSEFLSGLAEAL